MKRYFLIFISMLTFEMTIAQYMEVDLRTSLKGNKNYFGIAIRPATLGGHAFVIMGRENEAEKMSEMSVQGFYSKSEELPFEEGKVRNDFESLKYVRNTEEELFFIIDDADFESAVKIASEWINNPPQYNIFTNNCFDFTSKVAKAIGVKLPSVYQTTPAGYVSNIKSKLFSDNGLEYKNNTRVKKIYGDTYVGPLQHGEPNGKGRLVTLTDIYVGEFKDGKRNGKGISTSLANKNLTNTQYKNGIETGPSETILKDGSKITQVNDAKGNPLSQTYTGKDGSTETLIYNGSRFPVSGTFTTSEGAKVDIKKFYDNRIDTMNVHLEKNGAIFDGDISYKNKHSYQKGKITFATGDTYDGDLRDFRFHGRGHLVHNEKKDCAFLGLFCSSNSYDIVDDFENGSSPKLQQMGIGPAPSKSFPDPNEWKVSLRDGINPTPTPIPPSTKRSSPEVTDNLDPVPAGRPSRPAGYNKNNSYWDPVKKKWMLL